MNKSVRERFAETQQALDEVHSLVDSNTPSDLNKAATILKSLLPIYKDLTNNEESKRPENLETLKEIKSRLTEETQRVMSKKEEAKNLQIQQQQQQEQQLRQQQQQQILESTSRSRAFTSPELPKPSLLQGYLKKQGEKGLVKGFKKRWFQQRESKLFYYEKEGDKDPYGFINLPDMIGVKTVDGGFELATPSRVYIFQVFKPSDLNYWTEGLKDYKKYYQSLQNSQKFGDGSPSLSSSNSYNDFRKFSSDSTNNTPIIDRRGTVSGAMLSSTYSTTSTASDPHQQYMSSSYNPGDEELKRRENEILKRHQEKQQLQDDLQQQQSQSQSPFQLASPQQQTLSRSQSQNQLNYSRDSIDNNSNINSNSSNNNSNNNSVNNVSPVLTSNQSPQQSPYNSRHNSYNYKNSPIVMDYSQQQSQSQSQPIQQQLNQPPQQYSQSYQSNNNNISPKFESQSYNNENQSSYGKLNLESIRQSMEEELKKKFVQEKQEILDNENKKRQELENEIKRIKDLLEKSQLESHQKTVTLNIDLKNKNSEIEELKAQVNVFTEKNETLQEKVRELESIKPIETFPHEFLWTEEVTSRDQKILQQQQRIRELEESIKLKDNAVNVIKRENELLRHETEKKDKYINELLENNKVGGNSGKSTASSSSSGGSAQNDISKIKESLAAHQTQNSFLLQEINRLETQSQFKLDLKLQQIDELQKQMEEQLYQFHRFRESIIGTMSNEYCNKLEKENLDLKKEYFQVLGVSIKLHRLREGDPVNIDIASLFEKVIKENIHYRNYPEFLNQELKSQF